MSTVWKANDGRTFYSEREAIFHNTVIEGHRLVDMGDYDQGIDALTAAIDYRVDAIRTHTERMCCYAKRGEAYSAKKLYDMAISDYTTAIESYNSATRTNYGFDDERIAGRYVNRAKAYSAKSNYDNAIADFTEAIRLGYYQDLAYNDRGVAYSKKGNQEQAIADYKAAANWGFQKSSSIEATALGNLKNKGIDYTPVTPPEVIQDRIDWENQRIWQEKQDKKNRIIAFFSPFSIVDSDSGEGSTTIIGGLIAVIAGAIAWKLGGWIAGGIAAIAGGVFGGKFLGEIIHVKLLKVIIYIVILSALAVGGMYLYAMLGSGIGKSTVTRTEQSSATSAAAETSSTTSSILSSNAGWKAFVDGGNAAVKNGTSANISFGKETIQNSEKDVMTLTVNLARGTEWRIGEFTLDGNTFIQRFKTVNGIKFSVLGDGADGWRVMFPMGETLSDNCYHEAVFSTTNGRVTQVDIPYSKPAQPGWGNRVTFNRNSIVSIKIQRHSTESNFSGSSTIKVFDFETY